MSSILSSETPGWAIAKRVGGKSGRNARNVSRQRNGCAQVTRSTFPVSRL
jgi:hypothetical protein